MFRTVIIAVNVLALCAQFYIGWQNANRFPDNSVIVRWHGAVKVIRLPPNFDPDTERTTILPIRPTPHGRGA